MAAVEFNRDGPVAWREARPDGEPTGDAVVCLHGFPESSHMWSGLLEALADTGRPALAPDLYALGDSAQFGPATFENSLARFAEWIEQRQLGRVAIVVHDWGGFVGLAWACDHPDRVAALVISDAGFFADGKWHGMADAMRSDQGESLGRRARARQLRRDAQRRRPGLRRRRRSTRTGRRSPTAAASGRRSSSIARWTSRN